VKKSILEFEKAQRIDRQWGKLENGEKAISMKIANKAPRQRNREQL
jgi:hypothetical protein